MSQSKRNLSRAEWLAYEHWPAIPEGVTVILSNDLSSLSGSSSEDERSRLLGELAARMVTRYDPPPADEAHLWTEGFTDFDLPDGSTRHGVPSWSLSAPYDAWVKVRFPDRLGDQRF